MPDLINALFEFGGAIAVGLSILALLKEKAWSGFSPWNMVFFNGWGMWNLYYYTHLNQMFSLLGGICLQGSNITYLFLLWKYRSR